MKILFILLAVLFLASCKNERPDVVVTSTGKPYQDVPGLSTDERRPDEWRTEAIAWLEDVMIANEDSADCFDSEYMRINVSSQTTLCSLIDAVKSSNSVTDITGHAFSPTSDTLFYIGDKCIGTYQWFEFTTSDDMMIKFTYNREYREVLKKIDDYLVPKNTDDERNPEEIFTKAAIWLEEIISSSDDTADYYDPDYSKINVNSHSTLQLLVKAVKSADSTTIFFEERSSLADGISFYIGDKYIGNYEWFEFTASDNKVFFIDYNKECIAELKALGSRLLSQTTITLYGVAAPLL